MMSATERFLCRPLSVPASEQIVSIKRFSLWQIGRKQFCRFDLDDPQVFVPIRRPSQPDIHGVFIVAGIAAHPPPSTTVLTRLLPPQTDATVTGSLFDDDVAGIGIPALDHGCGNEKKIAAAQKCLDPQAAFERRNGQG